jgi:hypothetical protein
MFQRRRAIGQRPPTGGLSVNWKSGAALLAVLAGVGAVLALRSGPLNDFLNMTPDDTAYWPHATDGPKAEAPISPPPRPEAPLEGTGGVWRVVADGRPRHFTRWAIRTHPAPVADRERARAWVRTDSLKALPDVYGPASYALMEFDCSRPRYRTLLPRPPADPEPLWSDDYGSAGSPLARLAFAACGEPMRKLVDGAPLRLSTRGGRSLFHLTFADLKTHYGPAFWVEERLPRPSHTPGTPSLLFDRMQTRYGFDCGAVRAAVMGRLYFLGPREQGGYTREDPLPGDGGTRPEVVELGRSLCRKHGFGVGFPDPDAPFLDALMGPQRFRFRVLRRDAEITELIQTSPRPVVHGAVVYLWLAQRFTAEGRRSPSEADERRGLVRIDCRTGDKAVLASFLYRRGEPTAPNPEEFAYGATPEQELATGRWVCRRYAAERALEGPAGRSDSARRREVFP